jgi:hypothetical protein
LQCIERDKDNAFTALLPVGRSAGDVAHMLLSIPRDLQVGGRTAAQAMHPGNAPLPRAVDPPPRKVDTFLDI